VLPAVGESDACGIGFILGCGQPDGTKQAPFPRHERAFYDESPARGGAARATCVTLRGPADKLPLADAEKFLK
jgi:hypothetical protein